jgi:endonuclease-3
MTKQKLQARKVRVRKMLRVLKKHFPHAKMALTYSNNWELLVAVQLSAQCTDKMVNKVTEHLFKKYKTLDDYVHANPKEFEKDIFKTGFYKNKTKNILAAAKMVQTTFGGKIPKTMEEILSIPGVARKTANVVLGNAHNIFLGVAVDTHVKRFTTRFDLSDYTDPVRIERDLMELLPPKEWFYFTYGLIDYGRAVCPARKHDCAKHPLTLLYPRAATLWPRAK